jgi:hypothetical protein
MADLEGPLPAPSVVIEGSASGDIRLLYPADSGGHPGFREVRRSRRSSPWRAKRRGRPRRATGAQRCRLPGALAGPAPAGLGAPGHIGMAAASVPDSQPGQHRRRRRGLCRCGAVQCVGPAGGVAPARQPASDRLLSAERPPAAGPARPPARLPGAACMRAAPHPPHPHAQAAPGCRHSRTPRSGCSPLHRPAASSRCCQTAVGGSRRARRSPSGRGRGPRGFTPPPPPAPSPCSVM